MNYRVPENKDKSFENRYQQLVANGLAEAPKDGPVLVKPRAKYRGWCWTVYQRQG